VLCVNQKVISLLSTFLIMYVNVYLQDRDSADGTELEDSYTYNRVG
jgi:hypothetical protein